MNNFKFLLLSAILLLSACSNQASEQPQEAIKSVTSIKAMAEVEKPDFSLLEKETEVDLELESTTTAEEIHSLEEVESRIKAFSFNQDPEYLSCIYYGAQSCESQIVYEKSRDAKDASICNLLSDGDVNTCKDDLWMELALMEEDVKLCAKILNPYTTNDCKNSYYTRMATQAKDDSICGKLTVYEEASIIALSEEDEKVDGELTIENQQLKECKEQVEFARAEAENEIDPNKETISSEALTDDIEEAESL